MPAGRRRSRDWLMFEDKKDTNMEKDDIERLMKDNVGDDTTPLTKEQVDWYGSRISKYRYVVQLALAKLHNDVKKHEQKSVLVSDKELRFQMRGLSLEFRHKLLDMCKDIELAIYAEEYRMMPVEGKKK